MGAVDREVLMKFNEFCFDIECSWIGAKKNDPQWRTADTEELAVLIAHRSLDFIENCDLPQPQQANVKDVNANLCCFSPDGIDTTSFDQKTDPETRFNLTDHITRSLSAEIPSKKHRLSAELLSSSDKRSSDSPTHKGMREMLNYENDQSKARLLEALCHSQRRAWQAETRRITLSKAGITAFCLQAMVPTFATREHLFPDQEQQKPADIHHFIP